MAISAVTNDQAVGRMLDEILDSNGNYTEFQFRRVIGEIAKVPGYVRKQMLYTMLYAAVGELREAKNQAVQISLSEGTAAEFLDAAAAYHAANMLTEASHYVRQVPVEAIVALEASGFALLNAQGTYSFEFMELVMDKTNAHAGKKETFGGSFAFAKMLKSHGIPEDHVRSYVEECLEVVSPWYEGKGKPVVTGHTVDDIEKKAIVDIYLPAEPEEFGDIMVALSSIDKHKYSMALTHHVMVDAQLYEDA